MNKFNQLFEHMIAEVTPERRRAQEVIRRFRTAPPPPDPVPTEEDRKKFIKELKANNTKLGYHYRFNIPMEMIQTDEEIQLAAVEADGWNIQYIEKPSPKVQLAAVKEDTRARSLIRGPRSPEVDKYIEQKWEEFRKLKKKPLED